jgi:hypothetical protein
MTSFEEAVTIRHERTVFRRTSTTPARPAKIPEILGVKSVIKSQGTATELEKNIKALYCFC